MGVRISILVPVYNAEKYLAETLDSILCQNFQNYEIVLADDGSKDSSAAICDEYAARYPDIIKVYHKENEGCLLTRRFALTKASGDYIVFNDSDDPVKKNMLSRLAEALEQYNYPDIVAFKFCRFHDGQQDYEDQLNPFGGTILFEGNKLHQYYENHVIEATFAAPTNNLVKRECYDMDFDYHPWNVGMGEDVMQSFGFIDRAKTILVLDEALNYYRKNDDSMTLNIKFSAYQDYLLYGKMTENYFDKWNITQKTREKFYRMQINKFYGHLRLCYHQAKKNNTMSELRDTILALMDNEIFIGFCQKYHVTNEKKSLAVRFSWFKKAVLNKNYYSIMLLLMMSEIFGVRR